MSKKRLPLNQPIEYYLARNQGKRPRCSSSLQEERGEQTRSLSISSISRDGWISTEYIRYLSRRVQENTEEKREP